MNMEKAKAIDDIETPEWNKLIRGIRKNLKRVLENYRVQMITSSCGEINQNSENIIGK